MRFVLMLGPLVHKAHLVWLLVPFAVRLSEVPEGVSGTPRRVRLALILFAMAAIGLTAPALFGRQAATWVLAHGAISFGLAALAGALLIDVLWAGCAGSQVKLRSGVSRDASDRYLLR